MTYTICAYEPNTDSINDPTVRATDDIERALIHVRSFLNLGYTVMVTQE